ncbi:hypothetical protein SOVF_140420 [Spinacia oleracea]|nr:hypothetical protein SOVF_140420 [Spinacia oleracea]
MFTSSLILSLILVFLKQIIFTDGQTNLDCEICQGNRTNDEYSRNLNNLLSIITSNTNIINNGVYNSSFGKEPNKVYVLAVCRRDLLVTDCHRHITDSAIRFREVCVTSNESIGYYSSESIFRYSYKPILDIDSNINCTFRGPWPVPEPYVEKFRQESRSLFDGLIKKTAAGNSSDKSAAGVVNVTGSLSIYAITMCSPDLSSSYCLHCLKRGLSEIDVCCSSLQGATFYRSGCTIQFDNYPFFNFASWNSMPPSILPPFTPALARRRSKPGRGIYIVIGVVIAILATASLLIYFSRRSKQNKDQIDNNDEIICVDFRKFDLRAVQAATHNFSDAKNIGKGSSGRVYKVLPPFFCFVTYSF